MRILLAATGASAMAATATATLLFCDLVGSTELYDQLGDAAIDDVRRAFFAVLRRSVTEARGTEVKNLGDGLMVAFVSSAADAVACAIAMQRAVQEVMVPGSDVPVELRVGIGVGEATVEDGDWYGTPVNEAARLCSAAAPGAILVSDLVRSLVEPRGAYHFRPAGRFRLKGLEREVTAATVEWRHDGPVPPRRIVTPHHAPRPRRGLAKPLVAGIAVALVVAVGTVALVTRALTHDAAKASIQRPVGYIPLLRDKPCPAAYAAVDRSVTCADMIVPEDRANPNHRQVRLEVARLPARTDHPAAEPTVFIGEPFRPLLDDPARRHGEVIVLSRRGFDGSVPVLTCPAIGQAFLRTYRLSLRSPDRASATVDAADACGKSWVAAGVEQSSYTEREAAADFRDLAFVLHLSTVNLEASYDATELALRIAAESPGLIRSVIVSLPLEPTGNPFNGTITDTARALDRFFALCRNDPRCNTTYPHLSQQLAAYVAERNNSPKKVRVAGSPGVPTVDVRVDGDLVMDAVFYALQSPLALPLLPSTVAARNDQVVASFLVSIAQGPYVDPSFPWSAYGSQWCIDMGTSLSKVEIEAEATSAPQFAGLAPGFEALVTSCTRAKLAPAPGRGAIPSASQVPTLVLAAGLDAISSPNRAEQTARAFGPSTTLVVLPTVTGDPISAPDRCVADLAVKFLDHPSQTPDAAACIKRMPPPHFAGT